MLLLTRTISERIVVKTPHGDFSIMVTRIRRLSGIPCVTLGLDMPTNWLVFREELTK